MIIYHAISFFRDRADAEACLQAVRDRVPDAPEIRLDDSRHCKWFTLAIAEHSPAASRAIRAIKVFAARLELVEPERSHCGDVWGKWSDPRDYVAITKARV